MKHLIALLAAAALLAGCTTPNTITGSDERVKYTIVFTGEAQDHLKMVKVGSAKAGDVTRVSVELQNDSDFAFPFEYRFKWYDAGGMEIGPESSSWTPVSMMAQETKSLQSTAPNAAGAEFKLLLEDTHK